MNGATSGSRRLRAGPLSVTLEGAELRWLRFGPDEVIRGIYVAVRDHAWGTVAGRLEDLRVEDDGDAFEVTLTSRHREGDLAFSWIGRISGRVDGSISYVMDGTAETAFLRNRIGFCLLHPLEVAGLAVTVETPDGPAVGAFPERISPHQPFKEMRGIRWATPTGVEADVRFEGDLFEMEDQRNWTDASFKTYCTPLRIPYPVRLEAGATVHQAIHLRLDPAGVPIARRPGGGASRSAHGRPATIHLGEQAGPMPQIGVALSPGRERLAAVEATRLRRLGLGLLFVTVNLAAEDWRSVVAAAAESAAATGTRLRFEVIAGDAGEGLAEFMDEIAAAGPPLDTIIAFPASGFATTTPVATALREHASRVGLTVALAGGSRANFTELNRADLPIEDLDALAYPITPQVHAFDDASITETIAAQGLTVRDARLIGGGRPVHVGPITLRPRFNAYQGRPADWSPANESDRVDPRGRTWFCVPWMLASFAGLARSGASSVIFCEATGPAGIIDGTGAVVEPTSGPGPAEQVLAGVGDLVGAVVCATDGPSDVAVLAVQTAAGRSILLAHDLANPQSISISSSEPFGAVTAIVLGRESELVAVDRIASRVTLEVAPSRLVRVDLAQASDG
jgi:hypothetical protein